MHWELVLWLLYLLSILHGFLIQVQLPEEAELARTNYCCLWKNTQPRSSMNRVKSNKFNLYFMSDNFFT